MNELEKILQKIKETGYHSLTDDEKKVLKKKKEEVKDPNVIEEIEADFSIQKDLNSKNDLLKTIGKHIRRDFEANVKDLGNGIMEAVISSEALDRHGERIDMKGLNIKQYMKNPIIAAFHNYDEPSVGRTHKLTKTADGKLIAKFEWAKDVYDKARLLYNLYKEKFQFAFSIGFMPEEVDGNTFTKSTMLEFSPVLVPANPEALLLAKKKGIDTDLFSGYTKDEMKLLVKNIVKKEVSELTLREIAHLKKYVSKLTEAQKTKFASVLVVEKSVAEQVGEVIEKAIQPVKDEIEALKANDPVSTKDIKAAIPAAPVGKVAKVTGADKFKLYVKGLITKDFSDYLRVNKSAMSEGNTSEVLPPTEFIAEVQRLEEEYGVAARNARIRRSDRTSITEILGNDDLQVFDTAEAGAKQSTSLSYTQKVLSWRKFAGILPITDELLQDSAVDLFNDAARRFARALSQKEDQLVFTQTSGASPINPGILVVAGTNVVTMTGDSFEEITYADLSKMIWGVPTPSAERGKFYLNRELVGVVQRIVDNTGRPIWQRAMADGTPSTILGKPFEITEVLPGLGDDADDTKFMVFGDLDYVTLGMRTGLDIKVFDTGNVTDPDDEEAELNLMTQDLQAMRAVKRVNAIVRFPSAFSVLKTGPSAS